MTATPKGSGEFSPGDTVQITDGYFQTYSGVVTSVDLVSRCAVVTVEVFGRPQPLDLRFDQFLKSPDKTS